MSWSGILCGFARLGGRRAPGPPARLPRPDMLPRAGPAAGRRRAPARRRRPARARARAAARALRPGGGAPSRSAPPPQTRRGAARRPAPTGAPGCTTRPAVMAARALRARVAPPFSKETAAKSCTCVPTYANPLHTAHFLNRLWLVWLCSWPGHAVHGQEYASEHYLRTNSTVAVERKPGIRTT